MIIDIIRTQFGNDATNGLLFIDGVFECYTLEDQYQDKKVYGETCIPEGSYDVVLRKEGGFHNRYSSKYSFHKGMLWIKDVPEFQLDVSKDGFIGSSGNAYKKFYPKVADVLENGESVKVHISKIKIVDLPNNQELSNKSGTEYINAKDVNEKLSEINGQLKILTAKMDGKLIQ
jgi:hypothetical protein